MPLPFTPSVPIYVEWVTVCDTCGIKVSTFTMNDAHRAACVPCGHPARVSLMPVPADEPDAAA